MDSKISFSQFVSRNDETFIANQKMIRCERLMNEGKKLFFRSTRLAPASVDVVLLWDAIGL